MKNTLLIAILLSVSAIFSLLFLSSNPTANAQVAEPDIGTTDTASPYHAEAGVLHVGYVVLSPDNKDWQLAPDPTLHVKLDAIIEHFKIPLEPESRPNINTIDEQSLFSLMAGAEIWSARRLAGVIWTHIHDGQNTIQTEQDLLDIVGIGEATVDKLWPLVKVSD